MPEIDDADHVEIQHKRKRQYFDVDNKFVDEVCQIIGWKAALVYVVLCRYAGRSDIAWPSHQTIADKLDIGVTSVKEGIRTLVGYSMLEIQTRRSEAGKQKSNLYILTDEADWGGAIRPRRVTPPACDAPKEDIVNTRHEENILQDRRLKKTHCPPKSADGVREVDGFDLDDEKPKRPSGKLKSMVDLLYESLARKGLIQRHPSLTQWETTLKNYIATEDFTTEEMRVELEWYVQHIGDDFVPEAYSAKSFTDKIVRIRSARIKWEKRQGAVQQKEQQYVPPKRKIVPREEYDRRKALGLIDE